MGRLPSLWKCSRAALAVCVWLVFSAAPQTALSDEDVPPPAATDAKAPASGKIDVKSDRLLVDNEKRIAEFSGNVVARQAETTIEADRLQVYYKESGEESVEALEKIVATGNVRILFENGLAETPEAVYNVSTRTFVLTGAGSRVISGNSSISGEKITLHRDDGKVRVEGGQSRQVEAVFYPGDEKKQNEKSGQGSGTPLKTEVPESAAQTDDKNK
ncbi:MAG: lipopolysaccharide transport periplasmic protein LptA [Desulfobacterales bacterium]|jgi:lipopolysaccharide export system protein LptA